LELWEVDLLDRHIKYENEVLKTIVAKLQERNEKMQEEKKKLAKQVKKWYARSQNVMIENRKMRVKIINMKRKKQTTTPTTSIDIQINTLGETTNTVFTTRF